MLLISMVVALLAALQLGDFFNASDEFGLVILALRRSRSCARRCSRSPMRLARRAGMLTSAALSLAVVALTPMALPGLIQTIADRSTNPFTVGVENTCITLELIVPALLAVLVQWGLVRRRWLELARRRGSDALALDHHRRGRRSSSSIRSAWRSCRAR